LGRVVAEEAIRRRRTLYDGLCAAVAADGMVPLIPRLPDGVCPTALPIQVADSEQVASALHAKGVEAVAWWAGYHPAFDYAAFPEAQQLKRSILALPVHQWMPDEAVPYIAGCVRELVKPIARFGSRGAALV
jgi:hypothetical protein